MKNVILGFVAGCSLFTIAYLLGSFVNTSFDIAKWTVDSRESVGGIGGLISIMVVIATISLLHEDSPKA
jgi:hypothetical protein